MGTSYRPRDASQFRKPASAGPENTRKLRSFLLADPLGIPRGISTDPRGRPNGSVRRIQLKHVEDPRANPRTFPQVNGAHSSLLSDDQSPNHALLPGKCSETRSYAQRSGKKADGPSVCAIYTLRPTRAALEHKPHQVHTHWPTLRVRSSTWENSSTGRASRKKEVPYRGRLPPKGARRFCARPFPRCGPSDSRPLYR